MDVWIASAVRLKRYLLSISTALASAVLEWLLMFLLFLDASFSYFITKFAGYCGLQVPCLLCSRLDHVLGKKKRGFYRDLICNNHKLEISSLVYCYAHDKLVDVREMCENCLLSFATINESNAETYRLLVCKMGADLAAVPDHNSLCEDHNLDSSSDIKICSCCNEQWNSKGHIQNLLRSISNGSVSLSVSTGHDKEKNSRVPLSHVEYSKVKINSDTESEILSDDDSASALIRETKNFEADLTASILTDDVNTEKFIHPSSHSKAPILETKVPSAIGHGLEELNWQEIEHKASISTPSELISFDEVLPDIVTKVDISTPSELISFDEGPTSSVTKDPIQVSEEALHVPLETEIGKKNATESEVISKVEIDPIPTTESHSEETSVIPDTGSHTPNYLDLGDAYRLAVGTMRRQLSEKLLEQRSLKESAKLSEDLKLLLSQMSAARGLELPLNDIISPRVSATSEDLKGMHLLQRRISLERNTSGLSLDGSIVSEIEGEGAVERLKRQFEHDRKLMGALYKELEEERNASAVATNQAMAMITRLQEEKAALHMEALQSLRMMEEQAEYDTEALQKANELLVEKEKELQDLEAELEIYRKKMENVSTVDKEEKPDNIDETHESSLLELEDERLYILQCLKKLEEKLELVSSNGVHMDRGNGEISAENYTGLELKELINSFRESLQHTM